VTLALLGAAGYVLGSMPWGYWLPRLRGVDIRTVGSGNAGAANVWRALGFRVALAVALLDVGKGLAAALLGSWVGGEVGGVVAGTGAVLGHWRPLFVRFARGGKAVATTGGVGLALAPVPTLAAGGVWIAVFLLTRYSSAASLTGAASLPLLAAGVGVSRPVLIFTAGAASAIVVLHRRNIARLARGTENRFEFSRRARLRKRLHATH
jgi:glycerol-3-phosphate acyltransferase PlsY